jgi:hypothetical protein
MKAKDKYEACLKITEDALQRMKVKEKNETSDTYMKFIKDYVNDANHFAAQGDHETALEAVAYAHGFIDAGVLAGFFEIEGHHLTRSV